ncbi:MAG: hypothetical protein JJU15_11720, partial [Pararhodobacter sp.]|nr:hypothetical protein [Pararhodobacter sp.]
GAPRSGEVVVNQTTTGDQLAPDVAVQEGGDIVVSWAGPSDRGHAAYAQRVGLNGVRAGDEILVGEAGSQQTPHVRVAALLNGQFALTYDASDRPAQAGPYSAMVQRMRQRGGHWGSVLHMERVRAGDQRTPAITGLRRMGLATVWTAPDGAQDGIWLQFVGRDGEPIGSPELANSTTARNQSEPAVSRVGTTRHVFVVWTTAAGTGGQQGTNIAIRRFMGP